MTKPALVGWVPDVPTSQPGSGDVGRPAPGGGGGIGSGNTAVDTAISVIAPWLWVVDAGLRTLLDAAGVRGNPIAANMERALRENCLRTPTPECIAAGLAPPPAVNEQGNLTEITTAFTGLPTTPLPDGRVWTPPGPRPPKVPEAAPPSSPPPSSSPSPADRSTGRYWDTRARPIRTTVGLLSRAAALGTVWAIIFGEYFRPIPGTRPQSSGPPRRTRPPPRTATPADPDWWTRDPWVLRRRIRIPGTGLPVPLEDWFNEPLVRRTTGPRNPTRAVPTGRSAVPEPRPSVRTVPSPRDWTLGDPIPGPASDPYTSAPATPRAPRPASPAAPSRRGFPLRWPVGLPGRTRRVGPTPRTPLTPFSPLQPTPLTPQPPPSSFRPPRTQPPPGLTPFNTPVPQSQPQPSADPCKVDAATKRREQRRRRKECKKFVYKRIKVCRR